MFNNNSNAQCDLSKLIFFYEIHLLLLSQFFRLLHQLLCLLESLCIPLSYHMAPIFMEFFDIFPDHANLFVFIPQKILTLRLLSIFCFSIALFYSPITKMLYNFFFSPLNIFFLTLDRILNTLLDLDQFSSHFSVWTCPYTTATSSPRRSTLQMLQMPDLRSMQFLRDGLEFFFHVTLLALYTGYSYSSIKTSLGFTNDDLWDGEGLSDNYYFHYICSSLL